MQLKGSTRQPKLRAGRARQRYGLEMLGGAEVVGVAGAAGNVGDLVDESGWGQGAGAEAEI